MSAVPLRDQLACVRRELALRRNVYPKFVARGSMTQQEADQEIARMEAVLGSLLEIVAKQGKPT